MQPLLLASQSPRRRALLEQLGVAHDQQPVDIDETPRAGEAPEAYVKRMAEDKALAAYTGRQVVLASDTCGVLDGQLLLKPADKADAMRMWQLMGGRSHTILTSVCVAWAKGLATKVVASDVRFRPFDKALFERYWETGEPQDKAGGYAIQGFGAALVESMSGSYSAVMGLPLFETAQLLEQAEIAIWQEGKHEL